MTRRLYLIRGLPGTGKTTLARIIAPTAAFSNDDYFGETARGGYVRDWSVEALLAHAIPECEARTRKAMEDQVPIIAVHNTFVLYEHMRPYVEMAYDHGYSVSEIICTSEFGSTHGVPFESVEKMREAWEMRPVFGRREPTHAS